MESTSKNKKKTVYFKPILWLLNIYFDEIGLW